MCWVVVKGGVDKSVATGEIAGKKVGHSKKVH